MKILVVTQYFWPENFKINDLCEGLIEKGHEVTVFTGLPNYPDGHFFKGYSFKGPYTEKFGKIDVIRCPLIPRGKNKSVRLALNYISFCLLSTLLAPFLVRGKFDKIFIYQLSPVFAALPAVVLKYIKKAPIILWVTDLWPDSLEATNVVKNKKLLSIVGLFVKFIYQQSDKIFISSRGFSKKIEAMGVSKNKIMFWPQWAESLFGSTESLKDYEDQKTPRDGFVVMFAGNIGSAQDFGTIVEAATLLKNEHHIKFAILGDGLMRAWAEKEVQVRGLEKTFIFLGRKPLSTMPYYYEKASVLLVSLTDTELFSITIPSKVQTYLASGKPLLASLNGEGAQIVDDWKAGFSCNAGQPQKLSETIKKMSELSHDELNQMGKNAYACYLAEFERNKLISSLESEFKNLKY